MSTELPKMNKIDFEKLFDTAYQIMVLRGGPTSGNWAHGGRPGKKGGSGRGGGFKRIGVKSGKVGRKKIKQAGRQTRGRDERGKGGGAPAGSGEIPSSVVKRAKGDVTKAKKVRDKDFKAAVKAESDIAKLTIKQKKLSGDMQKIIDTK